MPTYSYIPYARTGRFPRLALDYLDGKLAGSGLYTFAPSPAGIAEAIESRKAFPADRALLQDAFRRQYEGYTLHEAVARNIEAIGDTSTFTVCTAHQPNLATGYLYFIYKILHAVKLAETLTARYPAHRFVPVFYVGSEDADIEELGVFKYEGRAYRWDGGGQTGAVGRMKPTGVPALLKDLFKVLGPPGEHRDSLEEMLSEAYGGKYTIAGATRYLINALMGRYGVLVIDGDDAALKGTFRNVMREELLTGSSHRLMGAATEELGRDYNVQASGREINLFYLQEGIRARIEKEGDSWSVAGTGIRWDEAALLAELDAHPEHFSPNVVLRPLYQETILPDVAFIGGGAEVSYWMQLRAVFDHHGVFFPAVLLRQSVWYAREDVQRRMSQLGMRPEDVFRPAHLLGDEVLRRFAPAGWETDAERAAVAAALAAVAEKAGRLHPTLKKSAEGAAARIAKLLDRLDQKLLRSHKTTLEVHTARLEKVLAAALPGGSLQERTENFISYYPESGPAWLDAVLAGIQPLDASFLIIEQ